jgi:integrase
MKLHTALDQYITLKRSLGFRFVTAGRILMAFSKAVGKVNLGDVEPVVARAFLDGGGPLTHTWALKWRTLRGFYRFAQARGLVHRSPLPLQAPKLNATFTPYIYTQQDLRHLLEAVTPERAAGLTPITVCTLILLLYGAGLRISEALQLDDSDVDLKDQLLHVHCSKFFKTRLVPIGPCLALKLTDYERERPGAVGPHRRFFRTKRGAPISCCAADRIFRTLRVAAGVERNDGAYYQPRLHDLRHHSERRIIPSGLVE